MLQIKQQTLPLDALLIEVIEEQRTVAQQKDIFLSLHIVEPDNSNEDNFSLLGDWDQLARLFTNLISNGLEHSFSENKNIEKEEQVSAVEVELKKIKRDRLQQLKVKVKDN